MVLRLRRGRVDHLYRSLWFRMHRTITTTRLSADLVDLLHAQRTHVLRANTYANSSSTSCYVYIVSTRSSHLHDLILPLVPDLEKIPIIQVIFVRLLQELRIVVPAGTVPVQTLQKETKQLHQYTVYGKVHTLSSMTRSLTSSDFSGRGRTPSHST